MRTEQKRSPISLSLSKGSKGLISVVLALTAFFLLFAGCNTGLNFTEDSQVPSGYGRVSVNITLGGKNSALPNAKTIFPNPESNTFTRYIYTFTPTAGEPIVEEKSASDHEPFTLPLGTYTVEVKAYDNEDDDDPAATGVSESFDVVAINAGTITVKLTPVTDSGEGTLQLNIHSPEGSELGVSLVDIDGDPVFTALPDGVEKTDTSIVGTGKLPAGSYLLTVVATRGDDTAGRVEVVHIYRSLETVCNITIREDELNVPAYRINLSQSGNKNFGSVEYLYSAIDPFEVTIHNNGKNATDELTIALSGAGASGYTLSKSTITDLEPSATATFTVSPKHGLDAGTYTATVTVTGEKVNDASFDVVFIVEPRVIEFDIESIGIQDHTGSAIEPIPVVKDGNITLTKGTHYEVTYSDNKDAGINKAGVIVTGIDNYEGSTGIAYFTIASYGIGLNHSGTVNITAEPGYDPEEKVVTVLVTNIGNQPTGQLTIALSGTDAAKFELSDETLSIAAGETTTFTVTPIGSLTDGTYEATVIVAGNKSITATFDIEFEVTTAPVYKINVTGSGTFTSEDYGYSPVEAATITVANAGNQAIGALTIVLSGPNAGSFTLSDESLSSIAVDEDTTFTVGPKGGLAVGTYTATVTVAGGNDIEDTLELSFTVTHKLIVGFFTIANIPDETYNRAAHKPMISITSGNYTLDTDYEVDYSNNTAASAYALVTITGKGNYAGVIQEYFTIKSKDITYFDVTGLEDSYEADEYGYFDPHTLTASIVVTDDDYTLATGEYAVNYSSSEKDEGVDVFQAGATVTVTITGIDNYSGTIFKTFAIVEAD